MKEIDLEDPGTWPASARAYLARHSPARPAANPWLAAWVRDRGPVTFADFMRKALYDPDRGYYSGYTDRIGPQGDFVTSPELHPAFGALVARWLRTRWESLGRPSPFTVVEVGGGTGAAATQILTSAALDPCFSEALRYTLLELFPRTAARQAERLASFGDRVRWVPGRALPGPITGVIWANEVLDALPLHRVRFEGGRLVEIYVSWRDGERNENGHFVEEAGPPSNPNLAEYFLRLGLMVPDGVTVEVSLEAVHWLRNAAQALARGWLLLLDYGADARTLYGAHDRAGSLRTYSRHTLGLDPFDRPGERDLTADVDFTTLTNVGKEEGLLVDLFTEQRHFLRDLGFAGYLRRTPVHGEPGHLALLQLVDPAGLGRIKVLIFARERGREPQMDADERR